jgi:hypothetical protein
LNQQFELLSNLPFKSNLRRYTMVADVIGTGLGFTFYDTFSSMYRRHNGGRKPNPAEKGVMGGFGACLSLTATMPLEAGAHTRPLLSSI